MNWNTLFFILEIILYPLLGLLFLFGVIRLFMGLRQARKRSGSEQHIYWYDYPATIQGIQALLLAFFVGCFLIANHFSDFFLKALFIIVSLVCGFFFVLSLPKVRVYASPLRGRPRKIRGAQPKDASWNETLPPDHE